MTNRGKTEKGKTNRSPLISGEAFFRCGYAPRYIDLSLDGNALFIGCKDGTVTVVTGLKHQDDEKLFAQNFQSTILSCEPKSEPGKPRVRERAGIRTLCEWAPGFMLIGRNDSSIDMINWKQACAQEAGKNDGLGFTVIKPICTLEKRDWPQPVGGELGSVTHLGWLDETRLLVSFNYGFSWIIEDRELSAYPQAPPNPDLKKAGGKKAHAFREELNTYEDTVKDLFMAAFSTSKQKKKLRLQAAGISSTVPTGRPSEDGIWRWIFFSLTGRVWLAENRGGKIIPKPQEKVWPDGEAPGFVVDFALNKKRHAGASSQKITRLANTEVSSGVYVSTDTGVYLLRQETVKVEVEDEEKDGGTFAPRKGRYQVSPAARISLPGMKGMCMAMTFYPDAYDDSIYYLWVSDTSGEAHLYWDFKTTEIDHWQKPNWRRSGIRHDEAQVLRAYATWNPNGEGLIVGQAGRNDRCIISRYEPKPIPDNRTLATLRGFRPIRETSGSEGAVQPLESKALTPSWNHIREVADFIEALREDEEKLRAMLEFLGNPNEKLALTQLELALMDNTGAKKDSASLIENAVALWSYVLLATVHRCGLEKRESAYSGIIRWLRTLGEPFEGSQDSGPYRNLLPFKETIRRSVEKNILFVRKWGVFGNSYNERFSIQMPLSLLEGQDDPNKLLDWLVYQSNLYHRCMDPIASAHYKRQAGRTAWDLRSVQIGGQDYLGVSWIWGGVDIFRVVPGQRTSKYDLERCLDFSPTRGQVKGEAAIWHLLGTHVQNKEPEIPPVRITSHGYSRNILFGAIPGTKTKPAAHFLLTAPAQPFSVSQEAKTRREPIQLWCLEPSGDRAGLKLAGGARAGKDASASLFKPRHTLYLENESVYSMLELEPGLILLGLRGEQGRPRLKLLRVSHGLKMNFLAFDLGTLPTLSPDPSIIKRNPVWSLTKVNSSEGGNPHVAVAGCADGQVWKFEVPGLQELRKWNGKKEKPKKEQPVPVGYLGAPVWAVAHRQSGDAERIFAGGADGTIVAWQKIENQAEEGLLSEPTFAKIWATWERVPIARIHTLTYLGEEGEADIPMVLAITQQGTAVFFNDREKVEDTNERNDRPSSQQRQRFTPGERHGRIQLGSTAFATEMVRISSDARGGSMPPPRLALASGDGVCRILEFNHLPFTPRRKRAYNDLFAKWRGRIQNHPEVDFHLTEATFLSSPALSLILIRCIADRNKIDTIGVQAQWLPRHVRPLFELIQAWEKRDPEHTKGHLERVLDSARKLNDVRLFKEIVALILNRCNHGLFDVASSGSRAEVSKETEIYGIILDELEKKGDLWLGASNDEDSNVRMVRAKNLMDGDTLWQISQRANQEGNPVEGQKVIANLFHQVLKRRIYQVRQLLTKGDSLLALETLRSCNLSLMRAAKRLVENRERKNKKEALAVEMPWEGVWEFFYTVSDFASGVAQSEGGLSVALAHEVARVYALGVCCVPSASIVIAHRFAEASLPQDLLERIENQFTTLGQIGIEVPPFASELFLLACKKERERGFTLPHLLRKNLIVQKGRTPVDKDPEVSTIRIHEARTQNKIGFFNTSIIMAFQPYNRIMEWIAKLTEKLTGDAREIDLKGVESLITDMNQKHADWNRNLDIPTGEVVPPYRKYPFQHTRLFLDGALRGLTPLLKNFDIKEIKDDRIRPEIVLFSTSLGAWCKDTRKTLRSLVRRHEMFEPESTIFDQLLEKLQRAAANFRRSAATQQNIVLGVLGHGLLESLDEHVLELEEVAQVLDPFMIWNYRQEVDLERHKPGSASQFAGYLLGRSRSAESIPKNLRVLQGLLDPKNKGARPVSGDWVKVQGRNLPRPCHKLFEEAYRNSSRQWHIEPPSRRKGIPFTEEEITYLKLAIKELVQNDRYHGSYDHPEDGPKVYILPKKERAMESMPKGEPYAKIQGRILIALGFGFKRDKEVAERLEILKETDLQEPIDPKHERKVPSHGTGLYLANLAAATVGWKLKISKIDLETGFFWFQLLKMDTTQAPSRGASHE